jgi:hypothetical protein
MNFINSTRGFALQTIAIIAESVNIPSSRLSTWSSAQNQPIVNVRRTSGLTALNDQSIWRQLDINIHQYQ